MARRKQREWERDYPICAPAVLEILNIYKDFTKRNYSRYAREYCEKLKNVQKSAITQALSIYQNKTEADQMAPHPNYFIVTCLRLDEGIQSGVGEEQDEPLVVLGRLI